VNVRSAVSHVCAIHRVGILSTAGAVDRNVHGVGLAGGVGRADINLIGEVIRNAGRERNELQPSYDC